MTAADYTLRPVAIVRSTLKEPAEAPMQGHEGAPSAWLELDPSVAAAAEDLRPGQKIILITWLHRARRDTLKVHPRDNPASPLTGVFATRSQDRPNPLGLHPVTILRIQDGRLEVGPLEAVDGTPVMDIKPVVRGTEG